MPEPGHRALATLLLSAVLAGVAACTSPEVTAPSGPVCAQIFSTNDTHGRLLAAEQSWSNGRPVGGSAAIAAYIHQAEAATPECPVFVVSGGDIMQGTLISNLTDGASTIRAYNAMGYDVVAIGNHEFDWGVDNLVRRIEEADFDALGANIYDSATGEHPAWLKPWTVIEKQGVRVGFVGMTTTSTPTTTRPVNVVGLEFRPISEALDRYVPEVLAQGVDFVIAVMHEGAFCDSAGTCRGVAIDALEATAARFDYAVTGHSHSRVETTIRGVPVVQSWSNSTAFGLGRIDRDAEGHVQGRLIEIRQAFADEVTPDPDVAAVVGGFASEVETIMARPVTTLAEAIPKPRHGDLVLGRLIADAQRARTGTQVAMMNSGGIRRPLPAGSITYADLFELQPFANRLVTMSLSGAGLLAALEHGMAEDGADAQISGLRVRYDPNARRGSRVISAELLDGTAIEPGGTYSVTVNDFMATGGGGFTMFLDADDILDTGIVDLEALLEYVQALPQPLDPPHDARWIPTPRP